MTTTLAPAPTTVAVTEPGDHDRFAHYVNKDEATEAYVMGTPIRAICGKVWVPSADPEKFPICPRCEEIKVQILEALA